MTDLGTREPRPMRRLLFVDTETRGFEATDGSILEVAAVLWDLRTRSTLSTWSSLVYRKEGLNEAEAVNRIPPALLADGDPWATVKARLWQDMQRADVVLAHNAAFDQKQLLANGFSATANTLPPWVCTLDDMDWPRVPGSHSLLALALAYDVGVVQAHRALADTTLLARLFERMAERGEDLPALLTRALRPKGLFKAVVPYEEREKAKSARFRWNEPVKDAWTRRMAIEDAGALPFPTIRIEEDGTPWLDPLLCNAKRPAYLPEVRCVQPARHDGPHRSKDAGLWS